MSTIPYIAYISRSKQDRFGQEKVKVKLLVSQSCLTLPWTASLPLSLEFSRQEYQSGLPIPSSGDCPDPGIKTALQADSLPSEPQARKVWVGEPWANLPSQLFLRLGCPFFLCPCWPSTSLLPSSGFKNLSFRMLRT